MRVWVLQYLSDGAVLECDPLMFLHKRWPDASLWSPHTSSASGERLSNESLTFVIFSGQSETVGREYRLKLSRLDISGQVSILDPDRRRNVTFFIYSGNSPIKRDFKATCGPCVCSVSVKLKCPSHMGDIFNNADVDPDSNLFPLNLGSSPRSLALWILLAARAIRSDLINIT